jgi:hypothetical protein
LKENNNKLVRAIMGLELQFTTSSTYYDIITELDQVQTIISKEKKNKPKTSSLFIKFSEYTTPTLPPPPQFSSQP